MKTNHQIIAEATEFTGTVYEFGALVHSIDKSEIQSDSLMTIVKELSWKKRPSC